MKKIPRIIFFGTDDFSVPFFREIIEMDKDNSLELVAVVSKPDAVSGRGRKITSPEVVKISREFIAQTGKNIAIFQPEKVGEINQDLDDIEFDAGVLVSFGKIIPQSMLDIFSRNNRAGIINFHPSLLPKLRGPSPIETAILDGCAETGLSLMKLVQKMDAGNILFQEKFALSGEENSPILREKMAARGREIFREKLISTIENLQNNPDFGEKQNDDLATFSRMISKDDATLNPNEITAQDADRKIRAFLAWPKARMNFAESSARFSANFPDQNIIITEAESLDFTPGNSWPDVIEFAAENQKNDQKTALKIAKIVSPKSGKEMQMGDYLRGLK